MGWNVPDDWGCYYNRCPRCGSRYHASEGGCDCYERYLESLEPCQCGACDYDDPDEPRCAKCGTGPLEERLASSTVHTARKSHGEDYLGRSIEPGDRYRRQVYMGYYPNGARTLRVVKSRVAVGEKQRSLFTN